MNVHTLISFAKLTDMCTIVGVILIVLHADVRTELKRKYILSGNTHFDISHLANSI